MKNFLIDTLRESDSYNRLLKNIQEGKSPLMTYGIINENISHILYGLSNHTKKQILFLTYQEKRARSIYEDIINFGADNTYLFPKKELIFYNIDAHSNEENNKRLEVLSKLSVGQDLIVVASIEAIFDKIISRKKFTDMIKKISVGEEFDLEKLVEFFVLAGYERVPMVEAIGQFSVRGGIVDYFPANSKNPVRVEFFDTEVDSIRSFDYLNQRSIENLDSVYITPAHEILILDEYREEILENLAKDLKVTLKKEKLKEEYLEKIQDKYSNLLNNVKDSVYVPNRDILVPYIDVKHFDSLIDYFKSDALVYLDEPKRLEERYGIFKEDFLNRFKDLFVSGELLNAHIDMFMDRKTIDSKLREKTFIESTALLSGKGRLKYKDLIGFTLKSTSSYNGKLELLIEDLKYYKGQNYKIIITAGTEERARRLSSRLLEENIENSFTLSTNKEILKGEVIITLGSLQGGFEYPEEKLVFINDRDIFGAGKKISKAAKRKKGKKILSFTDLKLGDYVVHENHGIGRYEGVEQLDIQGIKKDYLNIRYRDGDKLFVPIDQMHLIQKYIGTDSISPKVNKLSSAEWAKTKLRAKKAVEDMAEELLELYAKRESAKGFAFSEDGNWQREFEDYFPHEETDGQLRSIEEIKKDMESNKPMDRLLCGDVGYGKTEVALRAAFKAINDGKQVAFLVPTTILAQQHFNTIENRFENFPIEISMLSRFRSAKNQKETLARLKNGTMDLVVGTHRLLSNDVKFKDLGLLIIDEEQRFGVKHKEKMKQLKESIDVLTLTATPIPRTLHMSLSGIRDMSVIEEPPEDRYPVQTYVLEHNDQLIRDAILREINRGGQIYYVYNRVRSIEKVTTHLKELVPEASFGIGHGQMSERALENVMVDFYNKEFDVLVCTTIIETGVDIPNVNTIIIHDADKMGLSQLYQLRGRVGRANRVAYGYFTYERDKVLSEVAERRLLAIKEFTEFGSGFKIAMRDLEIRGAGNLLGAQQHGQIEAIGYDLYVKFLNDAVKRLKGEKLEEVVDTIIDLKVDGYIRNSYIRNEEQKVDVYKRIAGISDMEMYRDLVDELIDRFGDLPRETENLMDISYIRSLGSRNNIKSIIEMNKLVSIDFELEENINLELIAYLSKNYAYRINFNVTKNPGFKFKIRNDVLGELKLLLENIDSFNKGESKV